MTENRKKKIAAAISGVFAYIRQSEDAMAAAQHGVDDVEQTRRDSSFNLWSISSRQDIMNTRSMMQLKAFR